MEKTDCGVDVEHVLARDRTNALLESTGDRSELPVRVVVLKHRGANGLADTVVATEEKLSDRAEVELVGERLFERYRLLN